jgi:SnoaL-like domain
MAIHRSISAEEAADRLALRELGQMALFTKDARFVVYMDIKSDIPSQELQGRDALAPAFDNLNQYEATTHFNGQNTVVLDGTEATGVQLLLGASCIGTWK